MIKELLRDYLLTHRMCSPDTVDEHVRNIVGLSSAAVEEDMSAYRLAAARNDRLQHELEELHKRLLEERARHVR